MPEKKDGGGTSASENNTSDGGGGGTSAANTGMMIQLKYLVLKIGFFNLPTVVMG